MIELRNVTKFFRTDGRKKVILDRVSFMFEPGYSYGLLGVNGAGKSTTIRLISGAQLPNSGSIKRHVRVSWPLGFASGFHAGLSGRENLKFVARAYGADVRRVIDFVADFSELGDYLDNPVKTYSSGMSARLAFGLSMAIDFDCYLIDEITGVGDARFQQRCETIFARRRANADLIVVSHSMETIKTFCDRGIVLVDGRMLYYDNVDHAIEMYYKINR
jgi:capsular polysaccharide transport system ATP-binding protein